MLKIKNNIELKQLEKFGFEYFINGCGTYGYTVETPRGYITIIEKDNEFSKFLNERIIPSRIPLDLLYDLIEAGLVEKVVE